MNFRPPQVGFHICWSAEIFPAKKATMWGGIFWFSSKDSLAKRKIWLYVIVNWWIKICSDHFVGERHMRRSQDELARCGIIMPLYQSVEVPVLMHKSRILRQDEFSRILLSCHRARNSGPDNTSPKLTLLLLFPRHNHFSLTLSKIRIGTCATIFCAIRPAPTVSTNRNNYPTIKRSSLREFSVKSVKHRTLTNWPCIRDPDHICGISCCMKSHSVRDQAKIDHVAGKTIYPMTM